MRDLAKALKVQVADAVAPAAEAATVVLDKAREDGPREVEVKFGIRTSARGSWIATKASTESSFERSR